jgi:hypothetical protein
MPVCSSANAYYYYCTQKADVDCVCAALQMLDKFVEYESARDLEKQELSDKCKKRCKIVADFNVIGLLFTA